MELVEVIVNVIWISHCKIAGAKGWTQEELSERIGISRASLSHYEKDRREPNLETLTRLADVFQTTIDQIIGR